MLCWIMPIEFVRMNVVNNAVRCEESDALLRLDEISHTGAGDGVNDSLRNDVDIILVLRQNWRRSNDRS